MKAITLWQPWASLVAMWHKNYETRHWGTSYRGELLIHAAKRKIREEEMLRLSDDMFGESFNEFKAFSLALEWISKNPCYGEIVCLTRLVDCIQMTEGFISDQPCYERVVGCWEPGRYAWDLRDVQPFPERIPAVGAQGLWTPSPEVIRAVKKQANQPPMRQT